MNLYLLRHADAEPYAVSDQARVLTKKGHEQARAVGEYCRRHPAIRPDLILTSPYRRTVQTAAHVATALGDCPVEEVDFLASGMEAETALAELRAYQRFGSVMIVGHQPDLGLLASTLLGLVSPENLPVGKASLIGLDIRHFTVKGGSLKFFVPVELVQ